MRASSCLPLLALLAVLACSGVSNNWFSSGTTDANPTETRLQRRLDPRHLVGGSFEAYGQDTSSIWISDGPPGSCTADAFRLVLPVAVPVALLSMKFAALHI